MRRISIKKTLVLLAAPLLLTGLFGACTSYDYDEEMNNRFKEEARLKVEDEKIRAEIIAAIQALHTELLQNIEEMKQRVDGRLNDKDQDVAARFAAAENNLKDLLNSRARQAGVKIEELGTTVTNAIIQKQALFDQALAQARQELETAIRNGDEANIRKAQAAIDLITSTENAVKEAGRSYEERINRLLALENRLANVRTEIENKEAEKERILKQAQDFEDEMKDVIQQKIQTFRSSDLARIKQTLSEYSAQLSAYNALDDYDTELNSLSSDVTDLTESVEDAINKASDLLDLASEAEEAFDEMENIYEDMDGVKSEAESIYEDAMAQVQANLDVIEGDISQLESSLEDLNDIVSIIENWQDELQARVDEARSMAEDVDV